MIPGAAEGLESVALDEMGEAELLDRYDTKYLLPAELVPSLLEAGSEEYRVLTFDGRRVSQYQTEYYDTPDLRYYRDHLIGREPRCKVRLRSYLDARLTFLEMKWKTSRGRSVKVREPYFGDWNRAVSGLLHGPGGDMAARIVWSGLKPSLLVEYSRVTLVSRRSPERITFDLGLTFCDAGQRVFYPRLAVAEVKQARISRLGLTETFRRRRLREAQISKYAFGIARLRAGEVKTNGVRWLTQQMIQTGGPDDVVAANY